MKTKFKLLLSAAILFVAFAGCSKDSGDEDDPGLDSELLYGVKTGKIVYKATSWESGSSTSATQTVIFDDYGKRFRLEMDEVVWIYDAVAKKSYQLIPASKKYSESPFSADFGVASAAYFYLGDDLHSVWSYYPGFSKKSDKNVAGKTCSLYSWNTTEGITTEWGGWKRITFWMQSYKGSPETDDSFRLEATSFSETIPANSFTVPSDYTKL